MTTVLLTIALVALVMGAMAIGVIFSDRELKGSCGGKDGADDCFCERNNLPRACEQLNQALPDECSDHEHAHARQAQVKLSEHGISITE